MAFTQCVGKTDDSTTMKKKQEGERIKTVQQILRLVCEVYEYTRPTGLKALRFLNEPKGRLGIKTTHIDNLDISGKFTSWNGVTRIGTELKRKILDREIFKGKGLQERERPLLVIVITDGEVRLLMGSRMLFL